MSVHFYFLTAAPLKERRRLKQFILTIAEEENKLVQSINVIFCSDAYLLDINKQYLQHDYLTDIITFELNGNLTMPIEGEIYISVERVKENASRFGASYNSELHRVIFHGVLHLCAYKDKTPSQKQEMTQKEDYYLSKYSMFHVEH